MLYFFAKRPVFSFKIIVLWYAVNILFYFINMHLINRVRKQAHNTFIDLCNCAN